MFSDAADLAAFVRWNMPLGAGELLGVGRGGVPPQPATSEDLAEPVSAGVEEVAAVAHAGDRAGSIKTLRPPPCPLSSIVRSTS